MDKEKAILKIAKAIYLFLAMLWGLCDLSEPTPSVVKARSSNHWTSREFLAKAINQSSTVIKNQIANK